MEAEKSYISNLGIPQLRATVSRYPWFSYARELLLCRMVELEPDCLESNYKENLMFFPRRDLVLLKCRSLAAKGIEEAFEIDFDRMQQEAEAFTMDNEGTLGEDLVVEEPSPLPQQERPKIFVVGGDYFSKEDFEELARMENIPEIKPAAADAVTDMEPLEEEFQEQTDFESMDFVTETLAAIYAQQGYYEQAIEAYAKLILLYPEKSAYFASLVNEIKLKNK